MKCPSCGFESSADAQWCDMCKEPFRKRKETPVPAPAAPAPAAPAPPAKEPASAEEKEKLARAQKLIDKLAQEEKQVPTAPKWVRGAAWGFLAAWFIIGLVLTWMSFVRLQNEKNGGAAVEERP